MTASALDKLRAVASAARALNPGACATIDVDYATGLAIIEEVMSPSMIAQEFGAPHAFELPPVLGNGGLIVGRASEAPFNSLRDPCQCVPVLWFFPSRRSRASIAWERRQQHQILVFRPPEARRLVVARGAHGPRRRAVPKRLVRQFVI